MQTVQCRPAAIVLITTLPFMALAAPIVANIRAVLRPATTLVDIYYDVTAPGSSVLNVSIAISADGGTSYVVPARTFGGDYGIGVPPGANKQAVWDAGQDWNGLFTSLGRARVTAEEGTGPAGMGYIPAGSILLRDSCVIGGDGPVRSVYVDDFWIDRFEVTKELWDRVNHYALAKEGTFFTTSAGAGPNHPVQRVSWHDCVKWCNMRSLMEGRMPVYYTDVNQTVVYRTGEVNLTAAMVQWTADGYRLPTEAEWEKAARGGREGQHYPWPSPGPGFELDINGNQANYNGSGDAFEAGDPPTTPVDYYNGSQKPPGVDMANGYGLYDMSGNVWEWCWDLYGPYSNTDLTNPRGAKSGVSRVIRGGGWRGPASILRCAVRGTYAPSDRYPNIGFRCVLGQPRKSELGREGHLRLGAN